jgi:membrane protease YdiL (CAAX protease family)
MVPEAFASALGNIFSALFLFAGIYVYISLARQISARPLSTSDEPAKLFGMPEAIVAAALISLLLLSVIPSPSAPPSSSLSTRFLLVNVIVIVAFILILGGFLKLRGFDLDQLAGFSKFGVLRAVSTGAILLIFASPLIWLAASITQRFLRDESSLQNIVEMFNGSASLRQRIVVIILAVAIAPMAEEFVFRFFIYGVLKRYLGRFAGLTFNALLFAAVHAHLPSFAPLFVLGVCFTLAYEWSGSLLVAMSMHSLFNSLQLTLLAFPELSQR